MLYFQLRCFCMASIFLFAFGNVQLQGQGIFLFEGNIFIGQPGASGIIFVAQPGRPIAEGASNVFDIQQFDDPDNPIPDDFDPENPFLPFFPGNPYDVPPPFHLSATLTRTGASAGVGQLSLALVDEGDVIQNTGLRINKNFYANQLVVPVERDFYLAISLTAPSVNPIEDRDPEEFGFGIAWGRFNVNLDFELELLESDFTYSPNQSLVVGTVAVPEPSVCLPLMLLGCFATTRRQKR